MSNKRAAVDTSSPSQPAGLAGDSSILTPTSTPSEVTHKGPPAINNLREMNEDTGMDDKPATVASTTNEQEHQSATEVTAEKETQDAQKKAKTTKKKRCRKSSHKKRKAAKSSGRETTKKDAKSDESDDSGSGSTESGTESSSESSEDENAVRKAKNAKKGKKSAKAKKSKKSVSESEESDDESSEESSSEEERKTKSKKSKKGKKSDKKRKKAKKLELDDDDSESEESEESEVEVSKRKKKASSKSKSAAPPSDDANTSDAAEKSDSVATLQAQIDYLKLKLADKQKKCARSTKRRRSGEKAASGKRKSKASKKDAPSQYKRVDELWDSTIHNYKLKESTEDDETEFAEYAFLVRRCFNWENKYTDTVVDIKSKQLRSVLAEVMKACKSVSLEAEEPIVDPNLLFLYLEEFRTYYKKTLKTRIKAEKKRKAVKKLEQQKALCKTLVSYIDTDYADTKKTLYPLLEAGNITFDLLWALYKPNEIAVTSCYGTWDEPRCFKVDYATKFQSMQRGEWYCIEGKYLEYDGKNFGYGDFEVDVEGFKGPRKITSLATYPLKSHRDAEGLRKRIVERGERFVGLEGMQYQFHKGLAFMKKKKLVAKININGRVMVDPATFRRINPNYPISFLKPKEAEELFSDGEEEDEEGCSCCAESDDEAGAGVGESDALQNADLTTDDGPRYKYKWMRNNEHQPVYIAVEVDEAGDPITQPQRLDHLAVLPTKQTTTATGSKKPTFTEEDLLLTSPVVLGFAFSEKLWLEFTLSGLHPITYNASAFDSLVLPTTQKAIVRALVESHRFHAARTIDDVVQGKGKGLVSVLHGPPGTGKTLTAEGISELLRCPLYMVSAGELGTDPAKLEHELQKILDIAHSWGAVLLLDEADVFLERREVHDIHRNALVSIFLRLLEYFQGILFLTTNRVDTFDEAFQSRIHLPLRYGELTGKAKKAVWRMFLELVRKNEGVFDGEAASVEFSDAELEVLSRHQLNGRQIKNAVRTAQALALREGTGLEMEHVKKVLEVSESFERDLKGGTGYLDAMRSYT